MLQNVFAFWGRLQSGPTNGSDAKEKLQSSSDGSPASLLPTEVSIIPPAVKPFLLVAVGDRSSSPTRPLRSWKHNGLLGHCSQPLPVRLGLRLEILWWFLPLNTAA